MLNWSALLIYPILQSRLPVANSELECRAEVLRSFLHLHSFPGYIFRTRVHRNGLLQILVAGDHYYLFSRNCDRWLVSTHRIYPAQPERVSITAVASAHHVATCSCSQEGMSRTTIRENEDHDRQAVLVPMPTKIKSSVIRDRKRIDVE